MGIGMMCVYPFIGHITEKFGCRSVATGGILLNVLGTIPFVFMTLGQVSPMWVMVCLIARGAGQGATGIPTITAAYSSVPRAKLGLATTAINIVQRLGGPIATTLIAITVSLSAASFPAHPDSGPRAFLIPFVALIALQLLVLGSAIRLPVRIHHADG